MALKKFSDFNENFNKVKDDEEIDLVKKTGEKPEEDEVEDEVEEKEEEKVEETSKSGTSGVYGIIEENIMKFHNVDIKGIYELLKNYPDTNYFIRIKDNQLHVVKYNEKLQLNVNSFVDSLFKYYSTKSKSMVENLKIKGNEKFSLIENLKPENFEPVIRDISKLLSKQK